MHEGWCCPWGEVVGLDGRLAGWLGGLAGGAEAPHAGRRRIAVIFPAPLLHLVMAGGAIPGRSAQVLPHGLLLAALPAGETHVSNGDGACVVPHLDGDHLHECPSFAWPNIRE